MISFTKLGTNILIKRLKVRTYDSNALFVKLCYPTNSRNKPCISMRVFLFLSCRVSLAEYIRVLRVCPTMLQVKLSAC
jgi:hypothetical protein